MSNLVRDLLIIGVGIAAILFPVLVATVMAHTGSFIPFLIGVLTYWIFAQSVHLAIEVQRSLGDE